MKKSSGWQRLDQATPQSPVQNAQGFGKTTRSGALSSIGFVIVLVTVVGQLIAIQFSHRGYTPTGTPTTEMPKPVLEIRNPTPQDQTDIDQAEQEMLKTVGKLPANSPELFGIYGQFGCQAQERGMYAIAKRYFRKSLDLGPSAYKTYDFKNKADFEANYVSMLVDIGELKEAEKIAKEIWEKQTKVLGSLSEQSIRSGVSYEQNLGYNSKYAEQQKFCEKQIAQLEAAGKTDDSNWVALMTSLGESHQAQNQMHEAKVCFQKALAVSKKHAEYKLYTSNLEDSLLNFTKVK